MIRELEPNSIVDDIASRYTFISRNRRAGRNGKGEAIKRVLNRVSAPYVMLADSGNFVGLSEIIRCMNYLSEYNVFPDRYAATQNIMPLSRRLLGRSFNMLVKSTLSIDVTGAQYDYNMFRT